MEQFHQLIAINHQLLLVHPTSRVWFGIQLQYWQLNDSNIHVPKIWILPMYPLISRVVSPYHRHMSLPKQIRNLPIISMLSWRVYLESRGLESIVKVNQFSVWVFEKLKWFGYRCHWCSGCSHFSLQLL